MPLIQLARILGGAAIGVSVLLLAACGGGDDAQQTVAQTEAPAQTRQADPQASQTQQDLLEQQQQSAPAAEPQQQAAQQATQQAEGDDAAQSTQATETEQQQAEPAQQADPGEQEEDAALLTYLPRDATHTDEGIPIIRDNYVPSDIGRYFTTLWGIRIIDTDELRVGAPRDAIPAVTNPVYLTIPEASQLYAPQIPLVQVRLGDDARGYPLGILIWHEIVNDAINGRPVTITFCPLCNTAIAYERQVGERTLQFAVSGLLRNSDLVMYDRETETLWQQATGRAIIGNLVGARLTGVPATIVSFGQFREAFPDGIVMSPDTGWPRAYGQNPYVDYDSPDQRPFLYGGELDDRLPPKARVVSVETPGGAAIAYPWEFVSEQRIIYDTHDETPVVIFWTPGTNSALDRGIIANSEDVGATAVFERELDGRLLTFAVNPDDESGQTFIDQQTNSIWDIFGRATAGQLAGAQLTPIIASDHFWFAWWAFHPETEIVTASDPA